MTPCKWTGIELVEAISRVENSERIPLNEEQKTLLIFLRVWVDNVLTNGPESTQIPYQEADIKVFLRKIEQRKLEPFLSKASRIGFNFKEESLAEEFQLHTNPERARDDISKVLVLAAELLFEKIQILNTRIVFQDIPEE